MNKWMNERKNKEFIKRSVSNVVTFITWKVMLYFAVLILEIGIILVWSMGVGSVIFFVFPRLTELMGY